MLNGVGNTFIGVGETFIIGARDSFFVSGAVASIGLDGSDDLNISGIKPEKNDLRR